MDNEVKVSVWCIVVTTLLNKTKHSNRIFATKLTLTIFCLFGGNALNKKLTED